MVQQPGRLGRCFGRGRSLGSGAGKGMGRTDGADLVQEKFVHLQKKVMKNRK